MNKILELQLEMLATVAKTLDEIESRNGARAVRAIATDYKWLSERHLEVYSMLREVVDNPVPDVLKRAATMLEDGE